MALQLSTKLVGEKISSVVWCSPSDQRGGGDGGQTLLSGGYGNTQNRLSLWRFPERGTGEGAGGRSGGFGEAASSPAEPTRLACVALRAGVGDMVYAEGSRVFVGLEDGTTQLYQIRQDEQEAPALTLRGEWACHRWAGMDGRDTRAGAPCTSVAAHPDGIEFASVGEDGRVQVVRLDQRQSPPRTLNERSAATSSGLNGVAYRSSSQLLTASASAQLQLWDTKTPGEAVSTMRAEPSAESDGVCSLHCVVAHPDQPDMVCAGGNDGVLTLWDLRHNKYPVALTQAHTSNIWDITFHPFLPDHMFTCSEDGQVLHWDCNSSRLSRSGFSISGDGNNLSIANILGTSGLGVNSIDASLDTIVCGTDNEAIIFIDGLELK